MYPVAPVRRMRGVSLAGTGFAVTLNATYRLASRGSDAGRAATDWQPA